MLTSRVIAVVATAALALLGVLGNPDLPWVWIVAGVCACAVVLIEVVKWREERNLSNRLGRRYEDVVGRVLRLIADLADLTAREFDLWVVDLYLPRTSFGVFREARTDKLERSLSIGLTDVRTVPGELTLEDRVFGACFKECRPRLWWDIELTPSSEENDWHRLGETDNRQLRSWCGVVSANPVSSNLGTDCRGVLVVHARHDAEIVTKVLTALRHSEGRRRMAAACRDIHSQLGDL